jgi:hypothetical protein
MGFELAVETTPRADGRVQIFAPNSEDKGDAGDGGLSGLFTAAMLQPVARLLRLDIWSRWRRIDAHPVESL